MPYNIAYGDEYELPDIRPELQILALKNDRCQCLIYSSADTLLKNDQLINTIE